MSRKIFVQGPGLEKVTVIEVSDEADVAEVVRRALAGGVAVEEADAVVLAEDSDEEIKRDTSIDDAGLGDKASVHVGRCRRVEVAVRYGKATKEEEFSPAQRLRHVLTWATGQRGFDVSEGDAQDLVLVVPGQQQNVDLDDHVGLLLKGDECEVRLDLVPSDRIQG